MNKEKLANKIHHDLNFLIDREICSNSATGHFMPVEGVIKILDLIEPEFKIEELIKYLKIEIKAIQQRKQEKFNTDRVYRKYQSGIIFGLEMCLKQIEKIQGD